MAFMWVWYHRLWLINKTVELQGCIVLFIECCNRNNTISEAAMLQDSDVENAKRLVSPRILIVENHAIVSARLFTAPRPPPWRALSLGLPSQSCPSLYPGLVSPDSYVQKTSQPALVCGTSTTSATFQWNSTRTSRRRFLIFKSASLLLPATRCFLSPIAPYLGYYCQTSDPTSV